MSYMFIFKMNILTSLCRSMQKTCASFSWDLRLSCLQFSDSEFVTVKEKSYRLQMLNFDMYLNKCTQYTWEHSDILSLWYTQTSIFTFFYIYDFKKARGKAKEWVIVFYVDSCTRKEYTKGVSKTYFEIVPQEFLLLIWGSHQTLRSLPLPNVTWYSGTWPYTMTSSIDQTLHQFANLIPNWTLLPILTLLPNFGGFHRTLQRVRLANRGRLLLWAPPSPVPFWTCIWCNI